MKAQELRIGNWVYIPQLKENKQIGVIEENGRFTTKNYESSFSSIECLEPIILTKDWFIKLGFKKESESFISQNEMITLFFNFDGWYIEDNNNGFVNADPIKYVHELQNWCFILSGEELQVNVA